MGFRMKTPAESPEQRAARESARAQQTTEIQSGLGEQNLDIFRLFGRRSMLGGAGGGMMSGGGSRGATY